MYQSLELLMLLTDGLTEVSTYLGTYLPTCLPTYLPAYLPTYLPTCLPTYLPTCLPTYLPTYLPTFLQRVQCIKHDLGVEYTLNFMSITGPTLTIIAIFRVTRWRNKKLPNFSQYCPINSQIISYMKVVSFKIAQKL